MEWVSSVKLDNLLSKYPQFTDNIMYVLENSNYVTKDDMIQRTRNLVLNWLSNRDSSKNLYVLLGKKYKICSSGLSRKWLYIECKDLLPKHKIIYENQLISDNNIEIVIIDDWALTGLSLENSIDSFLRKNKHIKFSSLTFIITYCSINFDNIYNLWNLRKILVHNSDQELINILSRGVEKLGGFTKLCIKIDDFPDILPDLLDDFRQFPDILTEIDNYISDRNNNYYFYQKLYPLDISHLNKDFTDIFMDIVENTFFIIHSEYKIPDSTLFRPLLDNCRDPVNRDFLIEIEKSFT